MGRIAVKDQLPNRRVSLGWVWEKSLKGAKRFGGGKLQQGVRGGRAARGKKGGVFIKKAMSINVSKDRDWGGVH